MDYVSLPTADWHQVVNRYYRKREVYSMGWAPGEVDFSKLMAVAAPYGGPVAVTRDEKTIQAVTSGQLRPTLAMYSSSGTLLSSFIWDKGRLVGMGWTENERLICVLEDGTVLIYSVFGELILQFSMGRDCKEQQVMDVQVWSTGLVVLTHARQFYVVTDLENPRPRPLADPGLDENPTSWIVIDPLYTPSNAVEVFVATTSGTILVVHQQGVNDCVLNQGPFTKMAVSPTGKFLACFTSTGDLWVYPTDFRSELYRFPTQSTLTPTQMAWCGSDSIVMLFPKTEYLLMVTNGDWVRFALDDPVCIVGEVDGLRILSNSTCEFLQRVPDAVEEIFAVGSTAPAATLYDAAEHFERKSSKADEHIRSIKTELPAAVSQCIAAAGHEFSYPLQRQLLKAASFGKCFLEFHSPKEFVEMCKTLRVLNAVRHYEIGIPLTYEQYKQLTPQILVDRLVNRHQHLLAWRICDYLELKADKVMVHWASTKVKQSDTDDREIAQMIVQKLEKVSGVSYAEIASAAYKFGRPKLATMLLDYEPRAGDQVPLLISMNEDELALSKAIESGDTDLMYLALLYLKRTHQQRDFLRIVHDKPVAMDLLIAYCRQQDTELLKDLFYFFNQPEETAAVAALESYQERDLDSRLKRMHAALKDYSENKEFQFQARQTEEQIKLLLLQRELEASYNEKYVDLSLSDTLYRLCIAGESKRAAKLRTEFKVPDKRFWWIRIKSLSETRDWDGIEKLSKEKKSPIGYEPFVEACLDGRNTQEAMKYIPKIVAPDKRAEYYLMVGAVREAVDVALKEKDPDIIMRLRTKTTNRDHLAFLESALDQFQKR
eukprot:TRINITY_DN1340_c0_g1_i1.p1 TRINITY_DN1340_c0_g1~~TRINITY_DN1340_c0_g1_i1.p1  ORF type:complete len:828 (-),score=182.11 TRINITY_DN1340_c0_g1_i1:129-2612(-)